MLKEDFSIKSSELTTSKFPGATIRLSITLLIFVTRDKMEDCRKAEAGVVNMIEAVFRRGGPTEAMRWVGVD